MPIAPVCARNSLLPKLVPQPRPRARSFGLVLGLGEHIGLMKARPLSLERVRVLFIMGGLNVLELSISLRSH